MRLPDPDFSLSPITGYTRAHWEAAADGLLAGVRPYFDASGALVRLPGRASASGRESDGLEGFARTFLLAAIRVAGAGGHDPDGLLAPYADGLKAGPRGAWLPITDRAQPMVESASIAIALHLTKPWLWDKLDLETRERLADWLADALTHRPVDNNWMLFPLPVADFLAAAGVPHDDAAVERGLARLEDFYVGGGWYRDGERRSFDHYNGWALHLYPNLRLHLNGFVASSTSSARTAPGTSPTTSAPSPGSATQPPGSDGPDAVHTPGGREPGTSATTPASDTSGGLWTAPLAPTPNNSVLPNSAITATSGGPEPSTPSETSENSTAASGRLRSGGTGAPSSAAEPGRSASSVPRGETIAPVSHPLAREARTNTPGTLPAPPVPSLPFGSRADDRYRSRLREFLFAYAEWFGADGAPIH
ncbi:DUF2264 domain-containing protein, partial [Actinomadura rupiterrae]|uniref:DUF2264 domain-containing protein n=1 Tax=Actinomadura rupiterrae TaxID=559627 RepID=UPI0020A522B8